MEKRKKITLRFSREKYEELKKISTECELSIQSIFEKCFDAKIIYPKEELREILIEFKRQGNNLNQIAKALKNSEEGYNYVNIVSGLISYQEKVWPLLKQFLQQPQKNH